MTLKERLQIEPVTSEVEKLNNWLDAKLMTAGTEKQTASDLKLCVNEAVANLISYAFVGIKAPFIIVELALEVRAAKATLFDNGLPFDLKIWPEPEKPKTLENMKPGGFGISLIRERARTIAYESTGTFNRLTIECGPSL